MKKLLWPIVLLSGVGTGAASSWGAAQFRGGPPEPSRHQVASDDADLTFVPSGALLVPVTLADGTLTAYVTIECSLQVSSADAESVKARIPLFLHAINMQTFRKPLAVGPDQRLPDLQVYRAIVQASAKKVFGSGTVRRLAITKIQPA